MDKGEKDLFNNFFNLTKDQDFWESKLMYYKIKNKDYLKNKNNLLNEEEYFKQDLSLKDWYYSITGEVDEEGIDHTVKNQNKISLDRDFVEVEKTDAMNPPPGNRVSTNPDDCDYNLDII